MKAFAATDALVKDGKMGGCWIIANNVNKDVLSRDLHHKRWEHDLSCLTGELGLNSPIS